MSKCEMKDRTSTHGCRQFNLGRALKGTAIKQPSRGLPSVFEVFVEGEGEGANI